MRKHTATIQSNDASFSLCKFSRMLNMNMQAKASSSNNSKQISFMLDLQKV